MDLSDNFAQSLTLRQQTNEARLRFLNTELDVSLTFAHSALGADQDSEKRKRNLKNARKGYDTLLHFSAGTDFEKVSPELSESMEERLRQLRSALLQLGDKL